MAADVQVVEVEDASELDTAISSYVAQGYVLGNKTQTSATMIRKKEFSVLWAVIGFFICLLPLIIYLIIYSVEKDKVVEIRVRAAEREEEYAELERLADLRDRKVLTEEEYETQKRELLGTGDLDVQELEGDSQEA